LPSVAQISDARKLLPMRRSDDASGVESARELLSLARKVYNRCLDVQPKTLSVGAQLQCAHLRSLCLQALLAYGAFCSADDEDLSSCGTHWGRTACMFLSLDQLEQAARCLDAAEDILDGAKHDDDLNVIEARCMLKGWKAQVLWAHGEPSAAALQLDEARAILSLRGPDALMSTRLFVSANVALTLVHVGYVTAEESGDKDKEGARQLIRIIDTALAILGDLDHEQIAAARDSALRMKAHLCMLEEEFDAAAIALSQHSNPATDADDDAAVRILKAKLLLRTNQKAEACAQLLGWLRNNSELRFSSARTVLQLLVECQCMPAALEACGVLHERFVASSSEAMDTADTAFVEEFSELCELKYELLSESVPDSAAAAEHLETVIDGHCSGRMPVTTSALSSLGTRLWEAGCRSFEDGELHKAIEQFERCARFMEEAKDYAGHSRVLASLAHCYLLQNRPERAASRALLVLKSAAEDESAALARYGSGSGGGPGSHAVTEMHRPTIMARKVLVVTSIKQKDLEAAQAHVVGLLSSSKNDHILLAAICEEVKAMGQQYNGAVIMLCEQYLQALDEQQSSPKDRCKLAGTVRSLFLLRMCERNNAMADSASCDDDGKHKRALLKSLQLVAKRLTQEGIAQVCDDQAHLVWLANQAYNLATEGVEQSLGDTVSLQTTCELLQASIDITSVLPLEQKRALTMLISYLWMCKCHLRMAVSTSDAEETARPDKNPFLTKASNAVQAAFRIRQKFPSLAAAASTASAADATNTAPMSVDHAGAHATAESSGSATLHDEELDAHMALLNVEVALRRHDPNARSILLRAAETRGVTPRVLYRMSRLAKECSNPPLAREALELAFSTLVDAEPKDFENIGLVMRSLTYLLRSDDMVRKKQYRTMMQLLSSFASGNCPMQVDQLHWLHASSFNSGLTAFRERRLEDAEEWMSMSYFFTGLAPGLVECRNKMKELYQQLLSQLDPLSDPRAKSFEQRLSAQIFPSTGGPRLDSSEQSRHSRPLALSTGADTAAS